MSRHIVVVEDESLLRDLIAKSLENSGFTVTTAANAADAKRAVIATDPDAVVLDIELGQGPNGFDFAQSISQSNPDIGIVFLTNLPDSRFAGHDPKSLPKGVAYMRKSALIDSNELVDALEAVLRDTLGKGYRHDLEENRPLSQLSARQITVLKLVASGLSNAQIAEERGTTVRAVEGIVSRVFGALNIDPQADGNARVEAAKVFFSSTGHVIAN